MCHTNSEFGHWSHTSKSHIIVICIVTEEKRIVLDPHVATVINKVDMICMRNKHHYSLPAHTATKTLFTRKCFRVYL